MAMYDTTYEYPDVYVNSIPEARRISITSMIGTVGGIIGRAPRGVRNVPVKVTSWSEYIDNFANGMPSGFTSNSYLGYAVYGFFQNGGSELYILNEADRHLATATATLSGASLEASDAGAWAGNEKSTNKLWVDVAAGKDEHEFIINVYYGDVAGDDTWVEDFEITASEEDKVTAVDLKALINGNSDYFIVSADQIEDVTLAVTEAVAFTGGSDGSTEEDGVTLKPIDVETSLRKFDNIDDIAMIAHADNNTQNAANTMLAYCWSTNEKRNRNKDCHNNLIAIIGAPSETTTPDEAIALKYKGRGCFAYPWGGFLDSLTNEVKYIPIVGHYMGRAAAMIEDEGYQRVPAGVYANLTGIVSLSQAIDPIVAGKLNKNNIITMMDKPNYGIVVWGGRSCDDGRYINSLLLEAKLRRDLYQGLQPFVFQPNTASTWRTVQSTIDTYMSDLWQSGAFEGETAAKAYYVLCDETNNTPKTIEKHELHVKIAYREVGCAEFIIVDIYRSTSELR